MMNYKDTLNLPDKKFPMRGDLSKSEPNMLKKWYEEDLYKIVRKANKGKKKFILHDGPPYANGNIHIGHSVNKILKDIIIKFKGLMGYDSPYIPGWDCHGLPIELKVEKLIGKPGKKVSHTEFRTACRNYAAIQIEKQKKDFIRLGILGDWHNPYLTMNFNTEANIIRTLKKIIANGHLYRGIKPVQWCIDCCSTLSEAEVEYYDRISPSIDVAFAATNSCLVAEKFGLINFSNQISLLIWTTTPWTLPSNRAVSIHPDFDYQLIQIDKKCYILATDRVEIVMASAGIMDWIVLGNTKGIMLESLSFNHPFMDFNVPTVLNKNITLDIGTGVVHIAPSHGIEDYIIGKKYGLKLINLISPDGRYILSNLPILDDVHIFKANNIIIELLRNIGSLLHNDTLQHSYPHCCRHKTPIIFRATQQWFISMDKNGLRKNALEAINKVHWIPSWGKNHIKNMVYNRPDWCISRQRTWGVPMSIFLHNKTHKLHPDTIELMEIVAQKVEKKGIQAWWDLNPIDLLGEDASHYHKVSDTLDVWFDSGSTHLSVVAVQPEFEGHKPDMYIEGLDQHRGWFMSSLLISIAIKNKTPYRQVLTHGFTVDDKGHKMSKSIGNVISPQKIVKNLGADILRLWVASTDYNSEISISDNIIKQSVNYYRRIRNTARFIISNLNDFDLYNNSVNPEYMLIIDRWAVSRTKATQEEIINYYHNYDFHHVIKSIVHFCSVEMSSFYLDIIKDRQYTLKRDSMARRSCQTALYHIIESLVRWIAPIMSFTADEIWKFIPGKRAKYVFTEEWYDGLFELDSNQNLNNDYWNTLLQIRSEINKIIEQARINKYIKSSLEADITLYADNILANLLRELGHELYLLLLTSNAIVADYSEASDDAVCCQGLTGLKISLKKADGTKCPRCWHYKKDIGKNINYPEICSRCIINIAGPGETRRFV